MKELLFSGTKFLDWHGDCFYEKVGFDKKADDNHRVIDSKKNVRNRHSRALSRARKKLRENLMKIHNYGHR